MAGISALSVERHGKKRLRNSKSYRFIAHESVVPLVISELAQAAVALPIAFVQEGEGFVPVAVLSPERARNLFVSVDGEWLGRHVPTALRAYPFRLGRDERGEILLCVDEGSGLISDEPEGEALFDADGKPSRLVRNILSFLVQAEKNMAATRAACAVLQKSGLVRPWPIAIKTENGSHDIPGFFQVDEAAMNALADAEFLELRRSGALLLANCQLISMQNLPMLGQLAEHHARVQAGTGQRATSLQ